MAIYDGTQTMVADTHDHCASVVRRTYCIRPRFRRGSLYLLTLLMFSTEEQYSKDLDTVTVVCVITSAIGVYSKCFKHVTGMWPDLLIMLVCVIFLLSVVFPTFARFFTRAWLGLGKAIGAVNSRIILGLIFYLVLTPLALLSRIRGNDPLKLKGNKLKSTFVIRNHKYKKEDLEKMW